MFIFGIIEITIELDIWQKLSSSDFAEYCWMETILDKGGLHGLASLSGEYWKTGIVNNYKALTDRKQNYPRQLIRSK